MYGVNGGPSLATSYSGWHLVHQAVIKKQRPSQPWERKGWERKGQEDLRGFRNQAVLAPREALWLAQLSQLPAAPNWRLSGGLWEVAPQTPLLLPVAPHLPTAASSRSKSSSFSHVKFHFCASQDPTWDPAGGHLRTVIWRRG